MNSFVIALTIFAMPVDIATPGPITLEPETVIMFSDTTASKVATACERVAKALKTSGKIAFCGEPEETTVGITGPNAQ